MAQQGRTLSLLECVTCSPRQLLIPLSSKSRTSVALPWRYANFPKSVFLPPEHTHPLDGYINSETSNNTRGLFHW